MFRFLLLLAIMAVASASMLTANYYTDVESCASGLSAQAFIPSDKCITVPELPSSLSGKVPFKSFKTSCTQNGDGSVATSNKIHATSSSCGGIGVPVKQTIPAGCNSGGLFTCVADINASDAVTAAWPAVGAFFGDSACTASNWDVQAAFAPATCVTISGKKGSGSVIATIEGDNLEAKGFKDATTCDGTPTQSYSVPLGQCQQVDMPAVSSIETLKAFHHMVMTAVDLRREPLLVEWIEKQIQESTLLGGAPPTYATAGTAGKL